MPQATAIRPLTKVGIRAPPLRRTAPAADRSASAMKGEATRKRNAERGHHAHA